MKKIHFFLLQFLFIAAIIIRNLVLAPRRGNELTAHGIAMGDLIPSLTPCKGKSTNITNAFNAFAPSGRTASFTIPRAMLWAVSLLGFQPACHLIADNHIAANANAQLRVDSIGQVYARCYYV